MRNSRRFNLRREDQRRQPRPSRRRQGTRAAIVRTALQEA